MRAQNEFKGNYLPYREGLEKEQLYLTINSKYLINS